MKANVYRKSGSPELLQLQEVEKSAPKDREVLTKVQTASILPEHILCSVRH